MERMDDKLAVWLNDELANKGWSHRELARRAKVSGAMVSAVISGQKRAGWDFCAAIARPLGKTPEEVLRIAGLLESPQGPGYDEEHMLATYRQMSRPQQEFLLSMLRTVQGQVAQPPPAGPSSNITAAWLDEPAPDLEDIAELVQHLDELERRLVYDYIRWRLVERERRRNSSGKRQRDKEQDRQTIGLINLYEAVGEAAPEERERLINYLMELLLSEKTARTRDDSRASASESPPRNPNQAARSE